MQRSSWTIGAYLLVVFVSGVLVGNFGTRFYTLKSVSANSPTQQTPAESRRKYVSKMERRLKLTADQATQLQSILRQTHEEFLAYRERHRPEFKAIQDHQVDRVKAMLKPEQLPEYQKVIEEQDAERRARDERDRKSN